ncbi:MAG: GNAT family N-acetyltransferase [Anaerolineae bacterium]
MATPARSPHPQLDPSAVRAAVAAHMAESHRRLDGQTEALGPLLLYTHPTFGWTFFNTARAVQPISYTDGERLMPLVESYFRARRARPAWEMLASLAPQAVCDRLQFAGYTLDRYESLMACSPADTPATPTVGTPWEVRAVDAAHVDTFLDTWRAAYGVGADTDPQPVRRLFLRDLDAGWRFWCAGRGRTMLGTLAAVSIDGVVEIANVGTIPSARHQGVATALVTHCLAEARRQGDRLAYLYAAVHGNAARLYARHGFVALDTMSAYSQETF